MSITYIYKSVSYEKLLYNLMIMIITIHIVGTTIQTIHKAYNIVFNISNIRINAGKELQHQSQNVTCLFFNYTKINPERFFNSDTLFFSIIFKCKQKNCTKAGNFLCRYHQNFYQNGVIFQKKTEISQMTKFYKNSN